MNIDTILANQVQQCRSKNVRLVQYSKSISVTHHINGIKKNNMITSVNAEKTFDKIHQPYLIKNSQQTSRKRTFCV